MLCSGFMDAGGAHRRYMEPRFIIMSLYPTSWVYSRNRQPHRHKHTTGLVGSTKIRSRGFPNTSSEKQTLHTSTCIPHVAGRRVSKLFVVFIPPYSSSGYMRLTKYPNFFFRS